MHRRWNTIKYFPPKAHSEDDVHFKRETIHNGDNSRRFIRIKAYVYDQKTPPKFKRTPFPRSSSLERNSFIKHTNVYSYDCSGNVRVLMLPRIKIGTVTFTIRFELYCWMVFYWKIYFPCSQIIVLAVFLGHWVKWVFYLCLWISGFFPRLAHKSIDPHDRVYKFVFRKFAW